MATFLFTSVERTRVTLALFALLMGGAPLLRAGSIITLTNGAEVNGKLSVAGTAIHAEAESSPPDTPLTDVLEATFDDAPFTLSVFNAGKIGQLPPNWAGQNIGEVTSPGSVTVQDGAFTVVASTSDRRKRDPADRLFFVGMPWLDNGQFTARVASIDAQGDGTSAGIQFRDSLDPKAPMCTAVLNGQGQLRLPFRRGSHREERHTPTNGDAPIWLRFTREGTTVFTSISSDGNDWDVLDENPFKTLSRPLVGLLAACETDKGVAPKAVFDHVSLTPLPSSAQVLPAGVVLQGGSLLACRVERMNLDPTANNQQAELVRGDDDKIQVDRAAIAAVVMLPIERSQLAANSTKAGLLMRNGDSMDGDVSGITAEGVSVSSVLLGITNYKPSEVRACFLAPLQIKPAPFEVRLRDGSILNATAISGDTSKVVITDVSGVIVTVDQSEIAQIRAGTSAVQNMAQLDWKATGPNAAAAPAPAAAPAANGAAGANPAPEPAAPLVNSWLGTDQQQILEAGTDTAIEFPLPGKFRAFGVQVALASDSAPNATATIRFLTDGHELAKSPPLHVGDPPRFMELTLPNAAHLTLQAESMFPGTKVLYLDPVGVR